MASDPGTPRGGLFDYDELDEREAEVAPAPPSAAPPVAASVEVSAPGPPDRRGGPDGELARLGPPASRGPLEAMDVASLTEEYRRHGWELDRGMERRDLVERLRAARDLEDRGVPTRRLGSFTSASRLAEAWRGLEAMSGERLDEERKRQGFLPVEEGRDLLAVLKEAALFPELLLPELQRECELRALPCAAPSLLSSEERHRRVLVDRLVLHLGAGAYEREGIPARRLGSLSATARLAERWEGIKSMKGPEAVTECKRLGLAPTLELGAHSAEEVLKQVALWEEMPLDELRRECSAYGAPTEGLFRELLDGLLLAWANESYKEVGIPAKRLGSLAAAAAVYEEFQKHCGKNAMALHSEFVRLGLPWVNNAALQANLRRLLSFLVWEALPMPELQQECREHGIRTLGEKQEQLVCHLMSAKWGVPPAAIPRGQQRRVSSTQLAARPSGSQQLPWRIVKQLRVLRLPPTAGASDVRRAYRALALAYHPDKNGEELQERAAQKFQEVTEAYEALCAFMKLTDK